jgi:hypothetical protein
VGSNGESIIFSNTYSSTHPINDHKFIISNEGVEDFPEISGRAHRALGGWEVHRLPNGPSWIEEEK